MCISHFPLFLSVSHHIPGQTVFVSHFPRFLVFLPYSRCISHFWRFLLLSPYSRSYSLNFSFFPFFIVSHHIPSYTVFVSHFPRFSVFSTYSRSYSVHFSFFTFFNVSLHNLGPTLWITHFSHFSLFLAIFQVLCWVFLILHVVQCFSAYSRSNHVSFSFSSFFQFSRHVVGPTVCVSNFTRFLVFLP